MCCQRAIQRCAVAPDKRSKADGRLSSEHQRCKRVGRGHKDEIKVEFKLALRLTVTFSPFHASLFHREQKRDIKSQLPV
jgi:hypothetical protein